MICYHASVLTMLALLLAAPQDPEALRQAIIARCGIAADRLAVERWTDPPMELIVVKGDGPLSDAQLLCLDTMMGEGGGIDFAISDGTLGERFDEVRRRERLANARAELASRGLLDRLPVYDRERDEPAVFAQRLERLCGAAPGSVLKVQDDNEDNIVLRLDARKPPSQAQFDRQTCLINALVAAGFEPFGAMRPIPPTTPPGS